MYHHNSIKHLSFLYTWLSDQTVLFLTIQFSHLFALSLVWFGCVLWHIDHGRLFNANCFYTYMMYMMCKHILLMMFLNELGSFFTTQLNGSKYGQVTLTIQLNISHLFTHI